MPITHKELIEILKQLEDSACEEFSLQMEGVDLTLRRKVAGSEAQAPRPPLRKSPKPQQRESAQPASPPESVEAPGEGAAPARAAPEVGSNARTVTAPMAGTFFRRPAPEEPVFVEVGAQVGRGDPLCLIEVMKLFSTVYAECAGRVAAIEVEDGDSVQQGQTLILIEEGQDGT